jgi:hypothetical protein
MSEHIVVKAGIPLLLEAFVNLFCLQSVAVCNLLNRLPSWLDVISITAIVC